MFPWHRLKISKFNFISSYIRLMSSDSNKPPVSPPIQLKKETEDTEIRISGLARALGKFREIEKSVDSKTEVKEMSPPATFLSLLRNSRFVQMGDPQGKIVVGTIFRVVNDDLYIDFGGKFYCVCRRPVRNSEFYIRGAKVKLRLHEFELATRFLGAIEDLTLLEADATLIGMLWSPFGTESDAAQESDQKSDQESAVKK